MVTAAFSMVADMFNPLTSDRSDCISSAIRSEQQSIRDTVCVDYLVAMDGGHLYGPPTMRARWSIGSAVLSVPVMLGIALASLALSACGGSGGASANAVASKSKATATTAIVSTTDAQVISAWLAAEKAFDLAAITSNPNEPSLTATMVDPELSGARSSLKQLRAAGDVAQGSVSYGVPQVRRLNLPNASVVSCIHDQEIEVSMQSRQPVPGVLGQADDELVVSTMIHTANGWKLASQTVGTGQCSGS
jgi:hypothetical protein